MANRFLSNISINDAYTFPASDGTSGQVITTDGSGNLSFSNVSSLDGARSNFVYYDVKNSSGSTINKGTGVMAVGTDGNSGHILIAPMVADGSVEPKFFMGVLETTLLNGEIGKVVHFGQISQINTSTFTDGDVLWCDPANPGGFTITEPLGPNVKIAAAIVISASTNGKIKVRVQGNPGLHELHDVRISSQSDGQLLVWDNTLGVWKNNGTATIDYTNGRVGIGTTTPSEKLDVLGNAVISGDLTVDTSTLFVDSTNNRVGIGTSSPGLVTLDVNGFARFNGGIQLSGASRYIYAINNTELLFGTNNAEKMRITAGGNVGIGTTNPTEKLDVTGNVSVSNNIYVGNDIVSTGEMYVVTGTNLRLQGNIITFSNADGSTEYSRFDSSGRLGIGTTTPTNYLTLGLGGTAAAPAIVIGQDSDTGWFRPADNSIGFATSGAERFRIDSSGNLLIGGTSSTSAPALDKGVYLQSQTEGDIIGYSLYSNESSNNRRVSFFLDDTNGVHGIDSTFSSGPGSEFIIRRAGVEQLRIDNSGNLGIGVAPYTNSLAGSKGIDIIGNGGLFGYNNSTYITANSHYDSGWTYKTTNPAGVLLVSDTLTFRSAASGTGGEGITFTERFRIAADGNVGIGTTAPSSKLHVAGDSYLNGKVGIGITPTTTWDLRIKGEYPLQLANSASVAKFEFYANLNENRYLNGAKIVGYNQDLSIDTNSSSYDILLANSGNKVGIGTTNPTEKLEVTGNAKISGTLSVQNVQYANGDILTVSENGTLTKISKDNAAEFLGVNSKTLMQDLSFGESYINNYRSRVLDNTGTYFPTPAGYNFGVLKNKKYLDKTGVVLLPSGVKTGGLFSVKPKNGNGDFDFTRNSIATYVDEDGVIQVAEANVPRLNYELIDGVVQSTPALLLEPARTNLQVYSEEFDNVAWNKLRCTATSNQAISPDGSQNADLLTVTDASLENYFQSNSAITVSGNTQTVSFFLKRGTTSFGHIFLWDTVDDGARQWFDLVNGYVGGSTSFGSGVSVNSASIEDYGNGWYRCVVVFNNSNTSVRIRVSASSGNTSISSVVGDTLYVWGAQLELGSYATSYIPTSGTAVARAAEVCNGAGTSAEFNDSEGVLFAEISALANDGTFRYIGLFDSQILNVDRIQIYYRSDSNKISFLIEENDSNSFFQSIDVDVKNYNKCALNYGNTTKVYVNGFKLAEESGVTIPNNLQLLSFNEQDNTDNFYGKTKQLIAFDAALTDEQLEDLTSWDSFEELAASQSYILY